MRSAIALSNHSDEMSFSGYIVTRSSGEQEGGLLQRPITMVGSGAKGKPGEPHIKLDWRCHNCNSLPQPD